MDTQLLQQVTAKAEQWLAMKNIDTQTKNEIKQMIRSQDEQLVEAFYRDLEFGTGGLRGIMGVGSNRMNIYTVAMATQGLCNYLKKEFADRSQISVAIAHDNRNNGETFSKIAANVFSSNGIKTYVFESLRPTPELSFAIRYLKCQSGVVITASHNPKEYNGYKAYWEDGAQVLTPHDENIIVEVQKITSVDQINMNGNPHLIQTIGIEIDAEYIKAVKSLSLYPEIIQKQNNIKIVYTPIHGSGVQLVPKALESYGFGNIIHVPEQEVNDGNFPTVKSPNPEEPSALELAIKKGVETSAELILATDPDADRVGIAVKNRKNEFVLFNGNQTATLLTYYLLSGWKNRRKITGKEYIIKTIVTTQIIERMAEQFGVECYNVLTGFKYIADVIRNNEGKKTYIGGGEESYGYLAGDFVRDKDAVTACSLIAEAAAWTKEHGKSIYETLIDIYIQYGLFHDRMVSITKKGKTGAEEIEQMMVMFRASPPKKIDNSQLVCIKDYMAGTVIDVKSGNVQTTGLPKSNVLQFIFDDETIVTARPSGTEPKIKFYIGVRADLHSAAEYETVVKQLDSKMDKIIAELNI